MNNQELIKLIDELRSLPRETEWVEFKTGKATTNDKLGQYISAISNATCITNNNFGFLIFGIEDNTHKSVGTNYNFKTRKENNQDLELWIRSLLSPSIQFQFFTCDYNGFNLEIFKIPAATGEPTLFKKIPSIRFNSSLTDLRRFPHFIRTIYNSQEDWSAKIIDSATINDLDPIAIEIAKDNYAEKNTNKSFYKDIDSWSDAIFLDKIKVTINGKITNTAIILLGKQQSTHLISPSVAQITWKLATEEQAYEHFNIPLFTSVNDVLSKIRNVKYKFFPDNQLIATEVPKYDTEVILEALNNCIAHQDYALHSRIVLTEQTGKLIFSNAGNFFEGSVEDYTLGDKTPKKYRNRFLAEAMENLNMIDSMGYGIHKMYKSQKRRYFPLPDYSGSTPSEVSLEIFGHSINENYSKLLIEKKDDIDLTKAILLDKVQKGKAITDDAAKLLRKNGYIEGRKPNYYISAQIAEATNQKADYIKNRGFKDEHYKKMVLDFINQYGKASKSDIDNLLFDILPEILTFEKKKNKIRNLIYAMHKKDESIKNIGSRTKSLWVSR